jgi:hypothetical protein
VWQHGLKVGYKADGAMRETARLAPLRGQTLVWPLQGFLVVAHVEALILKLDLGERE